MDPFGILGVAASIITCVQLTGALLKRVGLSDHSKKDLNEILKAICGFSGAYEGLKTSLRLNEEDETRLSALQHLKEPLQDCKQTFDLLEKRLESTTFVGQYIVGTLWDAKLKRSLKRLQDAKTLFEIALNADQLTISSAVECYMKDVAEDLRDLATHINENSKCLLDLDEYSREQFDRLDTCHGETKKAVHAVTENVLAHDSIAKKRHENTEDNLHRVGHDLTDHCCEWRSEVKQKEKDEILHWLSSTNPTINQNAAWEIHEPQTGKWFICGKKYANWKKTPQSFLWVHGNAGCGKTVLSSTIIRDLTEYCNAHCTVEDSVESTRSLAYFYCSFTDIKKQNSYDLVSSLLAQLVKTAPSISSSLTQLHDQYPVGKPPLYDMKVELQSVLKLSGQTFLVIDALDECPIGDKDKSRTKVLALLTELSVWALPKLHVLVTSRNEPDIRKALTPLVNFSSISIKTSQVQPDIHRYITSQLANDLELKKWSAGIKKEIENTLVEQANGMFRWVFCQIDCLKSCLRPKDVRDTLKSLPKTLDEFYARTLLGIDQSYRQMTINAFQWLAFSKRPLRIEELAEAVLIDPKATPSFDRIERWYDSHDMLKVLSSLVTVSIRKEWHFEDELEIKEIRLAHFSVKEYLISIQPKPADLSQIFVTEVTADQFITESCLLYMKSIAELEDNYPMRPNLIEFPLLHYACRHWRDHLRDVHFESSKAFADMVFALFNSKSESLAGLLIFNDENPAYDQGSEWAVSCVSSPKSLFHNACCLGLDHTVQRLLELKKNLHVESTDLGYTLLVIVARGYTTVVDKLLNAGADVNYRLESADLNYRPKHADLNYRFGSAGFRYISPLCVAASKGFEEIVIKLLNAGADVNMNPGYTALYTAVVNGHDTIVGRLLEAGADVNLFSEVHGPALYAARVRGHKAIVNKLLKAGASRRAQPLVVG